jgi:cytochrome c oxidase assembly factor CtaG
MDCLRAGCGAITRLTWPRVLTTWKLDLPMLLLTLLIAVLYARGVQAYQRRHPGTRWPVTRRINFGVGLGMFVLATCSFIGAFSLVLFWVRAMQNVIVFMPVPMLLCCGAPITLLADGESRHARATRRVIASVPMRMLAFPAVISMILLVTPFLLYFSRWYGLTVTNAFWGETLHVELVLVGFVYFWSRIRVDPVPHKYPHLISVWISFVEGVGDAALALVLWLGHGIVFMHYYAGLNRPGGPSLTWDQTVGGGVFMVIGDFCSIPFLGALWHGLKREEQEEADASEADLVLAEDQPVGAGEDPNLLLYQPWWTTDPQLATRYGGEEEQEAVPRG